MGVQMRVLILAAIAFGAVWILPDVVPSGPSLDLDVAKSLTGGELVVALALVYLSGIGTSLTPCVYPLIPITLSVMGVKKDAGRLHNVGLAAAYVGGMVVTYDVVGIVLILTHRATGTLLGNPYVITPIAILFVILAMPMFGIFEIALPASLQEKLNHVGGPGAAGSFAMGLVAGIVAAPCSGPVTALIAGVVSQSGNLALGTVMMTIYAMGIGTLFFVLAAFSVKLPRSGPWMEVVKSTFGIALVALALLYLKDAYPVVRTVLTRIGQTLIPMAPLAASLAGLGVLLGALHRSFHDAGIERLLKGAGVALAVTGIFLRLGVNAPMALAQEPKAAANRKPAPAEKTFVSLDVGLKEAAAQHKAMLIDFGAEWCSACKELEKETYPAPEVRAELKRFVAVKVDGTNDDDATEALYQKYGVSGLPTVVFFDSAGKPVNDAKLTGFEEPAKFAKRLQRIQ